jgi:uncharacterized protein (TIGR03437 family)
MPGRLTAIPIPMKLRWPRGPIRHIVCVTVAQFVLLASRLSAASVPLQISNETAPPGGWAQIKVYAAKPTPISSGHLVLNFDPTAFGNEATVGLFGANADAQGLATVTWPQVDVQFSSGSGGIGQIAGLPVMVISVPVLASAAGRTVMVSATSPDSSVSVGGGSVKVQGTLSVQKIPAGMGVVSAGTVVPVYGTGFTPSTTVTIDGVEVSSAEFVYATEIDVTIGGATELVGKLARVTESGAEFDYLCFQTNDPVNFPPSGAFGSAVANVQPLFPLVGSTGFTGYDGYVGSVIEVQNPTSVTAAVTFTTLGCCPPIMTQSQATTSIPAGSWTAIEGPPEGTFILSSSVPVRLVTIGFCGGGIVAPPVCLGSPVLVNEATNSPPAPQITPSSLTFTWQSGAASPAARSVLLTLAQDDLTVTTPTVSSGSSWLSVSGPSTAPAEFSVSVNPSQLAVGTFEGSIVFSPGYGPSTTLSVSLTVTNTPVPMISANPASLSFSAQTFTSMPYSQMITLTRNSGPAPFSVDLPPGTWLKVSPLSGTTPATLTVTWDPAVTSQIYYQQRSTPSSILISAPGNAITIPATFNVTGVQTYQTYLGASGTGPNGLAFSAQTGSSAQMQTINVDPPGAISATAGQPWITLAVSSGTNPTVAVTANPAGLSPGVYNGVITISEPGLASIAVPVTLGVWSTPPPLTISQSNFTFVQTVGEPGAPYQTAQVDSGGVPFPFAILNGTQWLNVVDHYEAPAPTPILVGVDNPPTAVGEYDGSFTLQAPGNSVYVPVTLLVEPGQAVPPVVSQVVNAASGIAGAVSPGEIITIRGYGVGASAVSGLKLDASGKVESSLNGLEVLFDGQAAPLIYTSANQTNLIVPYEVAGKSSTVMQVVYVAVTGTLQTAAWTVPVVSSAPGVFTADATGTGQGAVVNQDGSVNSAANPAARGSMISIYATGEGQTSPSGVTGSVSQSAAITPLLPVEATIGGIQATVQYAGSAPGEVAGLLQVNAIVPPGATPGSAVPIVVSVGGVLSQAGATISVQ